MAQVFFFVADSIFSWHVYLYISRFKLLARQVCSLALNISRSRVNRDMLQNHTVNELTQHLNYHRNRLFPGTSAHDC